MIFATNLPDGYATEEEEDFVYLLHYGERVARFSTYGATKESVEAVAEALEMEAYGQFTGDGFLLRNIGIPERCGPDFRENIGQKLARLYGESAYEWRDCTEAETDDMGGWSR